MSVPKIIVIGQFVFKSL